MSPGAVPANIFRAYDIRGLVDEEITPDLAEQIGRAYGTLLRRTYDTSHALVGQDNRASSPVLASALIDGLCAAGVDVIDIGLSPSPVLYWTAASWAEQNGIAYGGVNVTASHNPPADNGFKLLEAGGMPLLPDAIQTVRTTIDRASRGEGNFESGAGRVVQRDAREEYLAWLAGRFDLQRPLRVAVDPGNGVAGLTGPRALEALGASVVGINTELDGSFPAHLPDPQEESSMAQLSALVAEQGIGDQGVDIGIGWDGDGDRLGVVDELGVRHDPDAVLALLARYYLAEHPAARISVDVKVSLAVIEEIARLGGEAVFSPTGHSLGKHRMRREGIGFGGEASAHYYFHVADPDTYTDDAVYAACLLLERLSRSDQPLSAQLAGLPRYVKSPEVKEGSQKILER